jgi:hypothetical protein
MQPVLKHRSAFIQVVLGIILVVFILLIFFGCTRWGSKHIDPAPSPTVSGTSKALIDGADARRLVATGALLVDVRTPSRNHFHIGESRRCHDRPARHRLRRATDDA